ncbi:MAG: hypothetical protein QW734_02110 [Candidatus Bathyarchaeia archaeon]
MAECRNCACYAAKAARALKVLDEYADRLVRSPPSTDSLWKLDYEIFSENANLAILYLKNVAQYCQLDVDSFIDNVNKAKDYIRDRKPAEAGNLAFETILAFERKVCEI